MKKRKLGNSGLEVSSIGFGCKGYESELSNWFPEKGEAISHSALPLSWGDFFDTAEVCMVLTLTKSWLRFPSLTETK